MTTLILVILFGLLLRWQRAFKQTRSLRYPMRKLTPEDVQPVLDFIARKRDERARLEEVERINAEERRRLMEKMNLCEKIRQEKRTEV